MPKVVELGNKNVSTEPPSQDVTMTFKLAITPEGNIRSIVSCGPLQSEMDLTPAGAHAYATNLLNVCGMIDSGTTIEDMIEQAKKGQSK